MENPLIWASEKTKWWIHVGRLCPRAATETDSLIYQQVTNSLELNEVISLVALQNRPCALKVMLVVENLMFPLNDASYMIIPPEQKPPGALSPWLLHRRPCGSLFTEANEVL